jgi:hypothetical protein
MSKPSDADLLFWVETGQMTAAEAHEFREDAELGLAWMVTTAEDAWVSCGVIREDVDRFADFLRTHVVKDGAEQDDNIRAIVEAFVFRERLRPSHRRKVGRRCGLWIRHEAAADDRSLK